MQPLKVKGYSSYIQLPLMQSGLFALVVCFQSSGFTTYQKKSGYGQAGMSAANSWGKLEGYSVGTVSVAV
jgi:hypothetical protein